MRNNSFRSDISYCVGIQYPHTLASFHLTLCYQLPFGFQNIPSLSLPFPSVRHPVPSFRHFHPFNSRILSCSSRPDLVLAFSPTAHASAHIFPLPARTRSINCVTICCSAINACLVDGFLAAFHFCLRFVNILHFIHLGSVGGSELLPAWIELRVSAGILFPLPLFHIVCRYWIVYNGLRCPCVIFRRRYAENHMVPTGQRSTKRNSCGSFPLFQHRTIGLRYLSFHVFLHQIVYVHET